MNRRRNCRRGRGHKCDDRRRSEAPLGGGGGEGRRRGRRRRRERRGSVGQGRSSGCVVERSNAVRPPLPPKPFLVYGAADQIIVVASSATAQPADGYHGGGGGGGGGVAVQEEGRGARRNNTCVVVAAFRSGGPFSSSSYSSLGRQTVRRGRPSVGVSCEQKYGESAVTGALSHYFPKWRVVSIVTSDEKFFFKVENEILRKSRTSHER